MAPKNAHHQQKLILKIAQEAQVLAEEKWIIEALTKIKKQRNCLQIERLHLENLKAQMKSSDKGKDRQVQLPTQPQSLSALDMMQSTPASSNLLDFEIPMISLDDESCNTEELNLAVTNSVFSIADAGTLDLEEEEDDIENCVIDMDMFMYGKQSAETILGK